MSAETIRAALSAACDDAGLPADGAPPPPLRTPPVRRRWLAPVAAAAAVALVVALVVAATLLPHRDRSAPPAAPRRSAAMPATFAPPSLSAASVEQSPPGPVVALVGYADLPVVGDLTGGQTLAVGADGRTYRSVDAWSTSITSQLLAPDGGSIVSGTSQGILRVVDTRTGTDHEYEVGPGAVAPAAFSPDGRYVAYQRIPSGEVGPVCDGPVPARLLDLRTGRTRPLTGASGCGLAFAPDGRRIAAQVGNAVVVLDLHGHQLARHPVSGAALNGPHAWSPDGRYLALAVGALDGDVTGFRFLALDATDRPPAGFRAGSPALMGWTDDRHVVTYDVDRAGAAPDAFVAHAVDGTSATVVSADEYGSGTAVDMAADLLPHLRTVRVDHPGYGPWPDWAVRPVLVALALLAIVAAVVVTAVRRTRRRRRDTTT
ncbi:WD40 repeat domain-containing protein [Actinocatenispora rupis]|uniref:WD40-like Beta Propeller Repeat n=1 Tax=Actinocatenispora rupis TaxID=519421 RepID=A0A8J3NFQ4_9ACTN|nr:WD40 repeat domain-containing protein [Actinocatenispora rupis]GID15577.1 hypothetical protein Aru02nite_64660 [Actinocatenispora rupis]